MATKTKLKQVGATNTDLKSRKREKKAGKRNESFLIILWVVVGVLAIKNDVTFRNHKIIGDAIFRFKMDLIKHGHYISPVSYDDMEPYGKTLFRIWDWGCSRILPPEKLELIRPYIEM